MTAGWLPQEGLPRPIAAESETVDVVDRMLTLDGLKIIYDKNKTE